MMASSISRRPRQKARNILRRTGESKPFIDEVVERIEALVYIDEGIGTRSKLEKEAEMKALNTGIGEPEIKRAYNAAHFLYGAIKASEDTAQAEYMKFAGIEQQPEAACEKVHEKKQYIRLDVSRIDQKSLIEAARNMLSKNTVQQHNLGERWDEFAGYTLMLLRGEEISADDLDRGIINARLVERTAKTILANYKIIYTKRDLKLASPTLNGETPQSAQEYRTLSAHYKSQRK